jgi:16S rRNA U516 pseudouridylate synthase RsuA-like enzyme
VDEEVFNIQLRKFLKKVGIQSQREIEQAIRDGIAQGSLEGVETLKASVRLQVLGTDLDVTIEDDIKLA